MKKGFCAFLWVLSVTVSAEVPKELNIGFNAEFETLNPIVNSMMAAVYVHDASLRRLVRLTVDGKPQATLITKIPNLKDKTAKLVGDSGQKKLLVKLEILKEAKWGDGTPLTCDDIKIAWEIGKDMKVSTPNRVDYLNIEKIEFSPQTPKVCEILFKDVKWDFYLNLPRPIPAHLERPVYEKFGGQNLGYERNTLFVKDPSNPGLWNGPYRVAEWKMGSHVLLVRNENFFGKRPQFDKLIYKFILNTATMESNLRSKNLQMISSAGLSMDQALAFEKRIKAEALPLKMVYAPGVMYTHVDYNMNNPILADMRVRKALLLAVNRQEMVDAFFEGKVKVSHHFANPADSWYSEDPKEIHIYPFDRAQAENVLDSAGWKKGADGYRVQNGQRLSLTIVSAADNKLNDMMEVFLQAAWKKVGVELKIKNYPARILFGEILRKRNFDLGLYTWVNYPDASQTSTLHSEMIPSEANSWSGSNRPGWKNKEADSLLTQSETEFDPKKRVKLMKKLLKIYTEEIPALPLYVRANNSVIPEGLKNYNLSGHSHTEYQEVESWSF